MNILRGIIKFINSLIPKSDKMILFTSIPDYSDNAKAFYEYIKKEYDDYKLIWIVKKDITYKKLKQNGIEVYKINSINKYIYLFMSKYIVSTHNEFINIKSNRQIYINVWHGMPIKSMKYLEGSNKYSKKEDKENKYINNTDFHIATSKTMKLALSTCINLNARKFIITGQPRNDKLFTSNGYEILSDLYNIDLESYDKIIFYLPTFRNGMKKTDGKFNNNNYINLDEYNEYELEEYLTKNNYLLLIKLHPLEESKLNLKNNKNIKILNSYKLSNMLIDLSEIINIADILITDYSSVYFDYLLLDRPIIFINTDEKEYLQSRGFIFDNPSFWRPGPKVSNIDELIIEISKSVQNPLYFKDERKIINSLVNKYTDDKSSERLYNYIFINK